MERGAQRGVHIPAPYGVAMAPVGARWCPADAAAPLLAAWQVKLSDAKRLPNSDWDARFPSFQAWARPWVQQLQAHPDHWPPLLAQRAAACLSSERAQFAAAAAAKGRAAAAAHKEAAAAKRTP
jgi:hypothetical protein